MKVLLTATLLAALPLFAHADAAEDAVEARHGFMLMLGMNLGTLSAMAKGDVPYDEAAASKAGANVETLSNYPAADLFIEGTANGEIDDSDALPAIWENPEDFAKGFEDLRMAAAGAGDAVMGGQESIGPVLQKLGGACKACHDDYRKPE